MQIRATKTSLLDWTGDVLALGIFEDETELTGDLAQLNEKLSGTISELIEEEEFKGKTGSKATTRIGSKSPVRKIVLVGLGKADDFKLNSYRTTAAAIARTAKKDKTLGISLPVTKEEPAAVAQAITEGILLALHQDNRFKSDPEEKEPKLETIDLLGLDSQEQAIANSEKKLSLE